MKVVISSLNEVIKTGLEGAELLEKADLLILFYGKGNDRLSVSLHQKLAGVKATVDFRELEDMKKYDMLAAYLCGTYEAKATKVIVISSETSLEMLNSPKIVVSSDLKAALTGKKPRVKTTKAKEAVAAGKAVASGAVKKASGAVTAAKENVKATAKKAVEKKSTAKAAAAKKAPKEPEFIQQELLIPEEESMPEKKMAKTKASAARKSLDTEDFKALMGKFKTDVFDAEKYAMSVLSAVKDSIKNGTETEKSVVAAMDVYGLGKNAKAALKGHYREIVSFVRKME